MVTNRVICHKIDTPTVSYGGLKKGHYEPSLMKPVSIFSLSLWKTVSLIFLSLEGRAVS